MMAVGYGGKDLIEEEMQCKYLECIRMFIEVL